MTYTMLRVGAVAVCLAGLGGALPVRALAQPDAGEAEAERSGSGSELFNDSDGPVGAPKPRRVAPPEPSPAPDPARPAEPAGRPPARARSPQGAPAEGEGEAQAPEPPARVPVPDKAAQAGALKLVKDVFAEEYRKKSLEDRLALAGQLLDQAADEGNDAATRYVMLREARDVAAAAGDVGTALAAVDQIMAGFEGADAVALKLEALNGASKKVNEPAQAEAVVQGYLAVSGDVLRTGDLDRAAKVASQADALARKAKNPDLTARVNQRKKDLKDLLAQFGAATAAARATLANSPRDAAAHVAMGRFYCLAAGDWERGLPMLAKGNDQALRKTAREDLAGGSAAPAAMAGIGDAWWELGEKQTGLAREHARQRAAHWYAQAVGELEGLHRTRVEKRLAAVEPGDGGAATASASPTEGAVRLLRNLVSNLPANVRPRKGQTWDEYRVGRWLTRQARSTPFDAVLKVSSVDASRFNGRDSVSASFEPVGPVESEGIKYRLNVHLHARGQAPPAIVSQFKRGTLVRVRGFIRSMSASSSGGNGVDIQDVVFFIDLSRPNMALVKPKPAALSGATATPADRVLETLARKMPDAARPTRQGEWQAADANEWLAGQFNGATVEVVSKLLSFEEPQNADRPVLTVLLARIGPVESRGVRYHLLFEVREDDPREMEKLRKHVVGASLRLRGVPSELRVSGWNADGSGNIAELTLRAVFEDYAIAPAGAPGARAAGGARPAAREATVYTGERMLDALARGIPADLRPGRQADYQREAIDAWLAEHTAGAEVELAAATVQTVTAQRLNDREVVDVLLSAVGPLTVGNIEFSMSTYLHGEGAEADRLRRLTAGSTVHVRGKAKGVRAAGWGGTEERITTLSFSLELEAFTVRPR